MFATALPCSRPWWIFPRGMCATGCCPTRQLTCWTNVARWCACARAPLWTAPKSRRWELRMWKRLSPAWPAYRFALCPARSACAWPIWKKISSARFSGRMKPLKLQCAPFCAAAPAWVPIRGPQDHSFSMARQAWARQRWPGLSPISWAWNSCATT